MVKQNEGGGGRADDEDMIRTIAAFGVRRPITRRFRLFLSTRSGGRSEYVLGIIRATHTSNAYTANCLFIAINLTSSSTACITTCLVEASKDNLFAFEMPEGQVVHVG